MTEPASEIYAAYMIDTGEVCWRGEGGPGAAALQVVPAGMAVVICDDEVQPGWLRQQDGSFTAPAPVETTLAEVQAARWSEAWDVRLEHQEGGCPTPLGRVDTDADSQRKISGGALAALIAKTAHAAWAAREAARGGPPAEGEPADPEPEVFSIDWTMADNSVVTHDADAMMAMGMAVTQFLSACQDVGNAIRKQIYGATRASAVAAIDINSGYPA